MRYLMVLPALALLAGCSVTNLSEVLKAAGQDQATVSIQVSTIYGRIAYCRTAILNGNVACNSDGISVKSEGASIGVPINVVPQIIIGPGTFTPVAPSVTITK